MPGMLQELKLTCTEESGKTQSVGPERCPLGFCGEPPLASGQLPQLLPSLHRPDASGALGSQVTHLQKAQHLRPSKVEIDSLDTLRFCLHPPVLKYQARNIRTFERHSNCLHLSSFRARSDSSSQTLNVEAVNLYRPFPHSRK